MIVDPYFAPDASTVGRLPPIPEASALPLLPPPCGLIRERAGSAFPLGDSSHGHEHWQPPPLSSSSNRDCGSSRAANAAPAAA
eukprot:12585087-Alexandrium_andersonii.AAC.1